MAISIKALLEAGAHFGHKTHRWNPKMKQYIFGERNGIYIINLETTQKKWGEAREAIARTVGSGKKVLFVGTKPQAQEVIEEEAERSKQFFVNKRWLGGMLTNFDTIKSRIRRMDEIDKSLSEENEASLSKKDRVDLDKENQKLARSLRGIRKMSGTPGLLFVVDPKKEHIAIAEAKRLQIPVIAITDTNCDPSDIDYVIPSNDDALKAIQLFIADAADACLEGDKLFEHHIQEQTRKRLQDEMKQKKSETAQEPSAGSAEKAATETPKVETAKAAQPKADAPKADKPKAKTRKAEQPKADTPKAAAPEAEAPKVAASSKGEPEELTKEAPKAETVEETPEVKVSKTSAA